MNYTFNIQYQPRNDLMFEIGYVGNLGRHQIVPVPFNQAQIATQTNPTPSGRCGLAILQLRLHCAGPEHLRPDMRERSYRDKLRLWDDAE